MKFKHFIPMMALALPLIAGAVPAKPGVHQVTNPDGSKVKIQCIGDEHFSYYTDAEGKKLYELTRDGAMIPMVRNGVALEVNEQNIQMLLDEAKASDTLLPAGNVVNNGKLKRAALDSDGRTTFNTKGPGKGLVILVEFSDRKFVIPNVREQFSKMMNQEGYSDYNGRGSAADYYKQSSDFQYLPEFDVYGPYTLKNEAGYYTGYDQVGKQGASASAGKYLRMGELVREAAQGLDKDINYADYDIDKDGVVDFIFFFFAGHGQADYYGENGVYEYPKQTCIWPHASSLGTNSTLRLDGKQVQSYACSMELDGGLSKKNNRWMTGIGTFCHEFGHVMGLPDLYDVSGRGTSNPGNYSVMAGGNYNMNSTCPVTFSGYERWLMNWVEYNELTEPGHVEINPLSDINSEDKFGKPDSRVYRLNIYYVLKDQLNKWPNEYFVIENRVRNGFDASMPQEGMFMWHIYYSSSLWSSNSVNSNGRSCVLPIGPSSSFFAWPNGKTYMTPDDNRIDEVIFNTYNDTKFNDFITDITFDAEAKKVSFDYNLVKDYPNLVTKVTNAYWPDKDQRVIRVTWDEVPEADHYTFTLYYINDAGNRVYLDSNNEKNVGKDTEIMVRNLTTTQFGREMHAYVRCHKVLPAKEISEELVFTPSKDLDENGIIGGGSGVETITSDNNIFAGQGYIIAPDDAQVFNMAGMRVAKENLPAGIYVVRLGKKAVKVVVK